MNGLYVAVEDTINVKDSPMGTLKFCKTSIRMEIINSKGRSGLLAISIVISSTSH
jgi:hypothetical protein